ncbi:MAG: ATP-dependent DNA ligase [Desulfobacteraceae bacterium]|nr:MAG: ATP-dependent DNA ligase [Desulfobacteraceae bacterium]
MYLSALVETSGRIGSTARKKEKITLIAELLGRARGKEIALAASYLSGRLPQGRLGVGWSLLERANQDLGTFDAPLHLHELDDRFEDIARDQGPGTAGRKTRALREILARCSEKERAFVGGLIMGELRQGAMEGLVLEGLILAASLSREALQQAFMFSGDIGEIARTAMEGGEAGLSRFAPTLFHPVSPMLASPVEGEKEALLRLGEAGFEYKIDGARVQIHKDRNRIMVFTRNLRDVTSSVPEVTALVGSLPMNEAILEGEVIAFDKNGMPLPFQTSMRRFGRIKEVSRMSEEIPLSLFLFDLLLIDGQPLFKVPYGERVAELDRRVPADHRVRRIVTADMHAARNFLEESLRAGHEGVMAKKLDSPYRAGQREYLWLKIKQAQTLDLVVLAAEWGHGRRRGRLSNLHLGARDPSGGGFVMLGKTFKGLTDKMLLWQTQKLLELEIGRDAGTVYVRPELVVEVAFSDLQESPRYPGGLALRFARIRAYRPDKAALEADTMETVRKTFEDRRGKSSDPLPIQDR